jgi:formate dehydrogenase subunit gamma
MTQSNRKSKPADSLHIERTFQRFSRAVRWEHGLLLLSVFVLLITGLPQKYENTSWSQWLLSTPERLAQLQQIHHIFALLLTVVVLYDLGRAIYLIIKRRLPGDMLPTMQDVRDAWQMIKYLLFLTRQQPRFGKFNFEQKIMYWFTFVGILILVISGYILWFPIIITKVLPGGVVPAAYLMHGNEAVALAIFTIIWHFYHVHLERLNLSIFTGRLSEDEMRKYHPVEFERLTGEKVNDNGTKGGSQ